MKNLLPTAKATRAGTQPAAGFLLSDSECLFLAAVSMGLTQEILLDRASAERLPGHRLLGKAMHPSLESRRGNKLPPPPIRINRLLLGAQSWLFSLISDHISCQATFWCWGGGGGWFGAFKHVDYATANADTHADRRTLTPAVRAGNSAHTQSLRTLFMHRPSQAAFLAQTD